MNNNYDNDISDFDSEKDYTLENLLKELDVDLPDDIDLDEEDDFTYFD